MKNVTKIAIGITMVAGSQLVLADGAYLIAGFGSSMPASSVRTDFDSQLGVKGANSSLSNGSSLTGGIGYEYGESLSVEGVYFNSGTMTYSVSSLSIDSKVSGMQFALVGSFPVNEKFSMYGKVGYSQFTTDQTARYSSSSVSASDKKSGGAYGLGAKYKLNDQMTVRVGYEIYGSDLNGFTVGAQLKF